MNAVFDIPLERFEDGLQLVVVSAHEKQLRVFSELKVNKADALRTRDQSGHVGDRLPKLPLKGVTSEDVKHV